MKCSPLNLREKGIIFAKQGYGLCGSEFVPPNSQEEVKYIFITTIIAYLQILESCSWSKIFYY